MNEHRFVLQPYEGPSTRHTCPQCGTSRKLTRYIDLSGEIIFPDFVGKCGRIHNCTYHYPPRQFFAEYTDRKPGNSNTFITRRAMTAPILAKPAPVLSLMDADVMARSLGCYARNNLVTYLCQRLGEAKAMEMVTLYQVGTSNHWGKQGATVFWQRDTEQQVRGGKVILFDPITGKRRKEDAYKITWVHSLLRLPGFTLKQCLFGLHLIHLRPNAVVAIVESEKTALIAAALYPGFIWLATGGKDLLGVDRCRALKGRKVVLYPDLSADGSAYVKWNEMATKIAAALPGTQIRVSRDMEDRASDQQRKDGLDIGDFLLAEQPISEAEEIINDATPEPPQSCPYAWLSLPGKLFSVPWAFDAAGTLARVKYLVVPLEVEQESENDPYAAPSPAGTA